ncbi:hypothetical protein NVI2019_GHJFPKLH_01258 [Providencia alcalifaciens]|nr:hypothetical protein NVI2019_GHJFPKLH_01258 [Providencia alcalifaciens]
MIGTSDTARRSGKQLIEEIINYLPIKLSFYYNSDCPSNLSPIG